MSTRCPYTALVCRCVLGSLMHRYCKHEAVRTKHWAVKLRKDSERRNKAAKKKRKAATR
jgi:hypothetical protein